MPDFCLKQSDLRAIVGTIEKFPQVLGAAIFGSRAKGDHKRYSDVDIVLYGDLDSIDVERIIADLEELPLLYQFDVAAYDLVKSPELRRHIERRAISIYEKNML
jgi:predicted nucleotidyltransferase